MFDFTKEVVINSKDMFKAVTDGARGPKFNVHGGGDYFPQHVVSGKIYKTVAQDGALAVLKINAANLIKEITNADKHFSLNIELSLDRDARSDWGTSVYYFKKPMLVDAFAKEWTGNEASKLAALLKGVLTDYKFVRVLESTDASLATELGVSAPASGEVAIVGGDYNVKVSKVTVVDYVDEDTINTVYTGDPANAPACTYTDNKVEFGTYNYLLKNLRMPTYENYRFTSPASVEMPVAGAKYVQYSFLYCVPRPGLGGLSVAGQTNHSTTTHVFFVKSDVVTDFEAALALAEFDGVVDVDIQPKHTTVADKEATPFE